jgi:hypothetical protein
LKPTSEYPSLFSSADLSLAAGKMRENSFWYPIILQNNKRLPVCIFSIKIAAIGSSSKRVTVLEGLVSNLKGLSHEIDFKNVVENGQILALIRAAAGFLIFRRLL